MRKVPPIQLDPNVWAEAETLTAQIEALSQQRGTLLVGALLAKGYKVNRDGHSYNVDFASRTVTRTPIPKP